MSDSGIQVDINEVLAVTQRRLQEALNQTVMMEAFITQQNKEIQALRETIDKMGESDSE